MIASHQKSSPSISQSKLQGNSGDAARAVLPLPLRGGDDSMVGDIGGVLREAVYHSAPLVLPSSRGVRWLGGTGLRLEERAQRSPRGGVAFPEFCYPCRRCEGWWDSTGIPEACAPAAEHKHGVLICPPPSPSEESLRGSTTVSA